MVSKPKFMEIDLSRMLENPKCAIHIPTQKDAHIVLYNARQQFPDLVKSFDAHGYWIVYEESTAYTLFYREDKKPTTLSYSNVAWFLDNGYEVIELSDLVGISVDIDESDHSIEELIGVIV